MLFSKRRNHSLGMVCWHSVDEPQIYRTGVDIVENTTFFLLHCFAEMPYLHRNKKRTWDSLRLTGGHKSQGLIKCRLNFLGGTSLRPVVCLNNGSLSGSIFPLLSVAQLLQLWVWWTVGEQMLSQKGKQHTKSQNPLGKSYKNLWCCTDIGVCTQIFSWFSTR